MRNLAIVCLLAWAVSCCGCRVGRLGKSVVKNQGQTAEGILFTDTLFTDDGRSRLTGPSK
ncbi:MAG: hypothetical protein NTX71_08155 [Candidatus Aureabacteria bacterium]|nr:hypothetical protein [Candidatus Auribacterota bacterium]